MKKLYIVLSLIVSSLCIGMHLKPMDMDTEECFMIKPTNKGQDFKQSFTAKEKNVSQGSAHQSPLMSSWKSSPCSSPAQQVSPLSLSPNESPSTAERNAKALKEAHAQMKQNDKVKKATMCLSAPASPDMNMGLANLFVVTKALPQSTASVQAAACSSSINNKKPVRRNLFKPAQSSGQIPNK